jgi:hypothetical protein
VVIWYIFSGLGIMYQQKPGNPGLNVALHRNAFRFLLTFK